MTQDDLTVSLFELASSQRWFSGRAGAPTGVRLGDWVMPPEPGPGLRPALLDVAMPSGIVDRFLIPLLYRPGQPPIDACDDAGVILDALREQAPGFTALRTIPEGLAPRRFTGEQSNTTVFFGEVLLAKVFRRIEPGRNVDAEIHAALAGTGTVADLYGTWSVDGSDYAVFLEALPEPTDGFVLARSYAEQDRDFTTQARATGESLARVHAALAERLGTGTLDGAELAAQLTSRFDAIAAQFPQISAFVDAAHRVFEQVGSLEVVTQRIHGDCHLGQVLLTQDRWVYVDFEGEPLKSMAERRAPDSPLRDVAGMLRSFRYAAALGGAPDRWRRACYDAFLDGYGLRGNQSASLVTAYETDKAAYELSYEARFRPHLMHVPLDFLTELTQRSS